MTCHSLEPLRPWKAEQLGSGYRLSSWVERTAIERADAVIAVSRAMRGRRAAGVPGRRPGPGARSCYNGIDPDEFFPDPRMDGIERMGVDPSAPIVLFVGRVTRQKGITYLLEAAKAFDPDAQAVFWSAPRHTRDRAGGAGPGDRAGVRTRKGVFWVEEMLPRPELVQLMSHAAVFVCPSIYEPFGMINVEAMSCARARRRQRRRWRCPRSWLTAKPAFWCPPGQRGRLWHPGRS